MDCAFRRPADRCLVGIAFSSKQSDGRDNHAVEEVAALRRLLLNESRLQRMGRVVRAEPFERRYRSIDHSAEWDRTGTLSMVVDQDSASAALAWSTSVFRTVLTEVVAKNEEEGRLRISGNALFAAVDTNGNFTRPTQHGAISMQRKSATVTFSSAGPRASAGA